MITNHAAQHVTYRHRTRYTDIMLQHRKYETRESHFLPFVSWEKEGEKCNVVVMLPFINITSIVAWEKHHRKPRVPHTVDVIYYISSTTASHGRQMRAYRRDLMSLYIQKSNLFLSAFIQIKYKI